MISLLGLLLKTENIVSGLATIYNGATNSDRRRHSLGALVHPQSTQSGSIYGK
jgi:hypothetical protein